MRSVAEAQQIVLDNTQPLLPEVVELNSSALGRFLAEEIASDVDSPPYAKSLMDGYAVRFEDVTVLPRELPVIEEIAAGRLPVKSLAAGQCARIFTGAAVPVGCTAVVPQEFVEMVTEDRIAIRVAARAGQFILDAGREMKRGQVVLSKGERIGPESYGILSAVGRRSFLGYPQPRVAIIATGNELVEPTKVPQPGQIRNTNGPMLLGQTVRAGGVPHYFGIATDRREELIDLVQQGLAASEILVLAGGVSVGKFDLVPDVLKEVGVVEQFHKVAMKPGKPLFFGTRGTQLVFGLPGNPVSAFVGFELFVRPALRKLSGAPTYRLMQVRLPLTGRFETENDRPTYFPARVEFGSEQLEVEPLAWFGSSDLIRIRGVNALLVLPPGKLDFPLGHRIETILLDVD